ncbi:MAG TPA: PKD domain-containing protein, partial [Bacteroidia bacterium]|nr:PKD domain-containing protein [Bacteroidia bacterium]
VGIPSIGTTIADGAGYWVYMGTNQPQDPTPGEFISVTGTPQIGNFGWTLTNSNGGAATDGFNSLANPYPSPISWAKLAARNGNAITTYYAYNSVTQAYSTYIVGGGGTTSGSYALSDVIPAGLGFYVQTFAGSLPFNIQEGDKTAGNQIIGRMANPNQVQSATPMFNLVIEGANANALHEEAAISFNPNSTTGLDAYDALAFPWNGVLQITTASLGNNFAINGMPGLTQNYAIPVKILSGTTTQYTMSTKNLQSLPAGACVKLHDNYNVIPDQDLHAGAFTVTINDSETVARFVLNITITPLAITTNTVTASCHVKNDGSITAVGNDAGPWNYIWKNAGGTIVKTSLNKATADTLTGLNNGVYSVDVSTVGSCNSATQTFTLTAPAAAASAFTASSQINAGDNVVLTNNSANATNYVWSFGDGDISSMQTPNYIYNNAGTYTITLQAINANCNDTATSTQVITVNATTGIKQANTGDGNINLSRDASGNYIQFDYTNQTKVSISVYNVLGQVVLNDAELSVVNDKIYINISDNKNQVLYVNITNLTTNKQTTKKFVND